MTRLTKKMITEIPHECAKSKTFTMKLGDLPNMVDAVFDGDHKMPGWVHMFANAKGCDHVDALFPQAQYRVARTAAAGLAGRLARYEGQLAGSRLDDNNKLAA